MILIIESHILAPIIIIKTVSGEFTKQNTDDREYKPIVWPTPDYKNWIKTTLFETKRRQTLSYSVCSIAGFRHRYLV